MDDERIIQLYWSREEAAVEETSQKYGGLCKMIANNLLHNLEDTQECVNDVYHALWNSIPPQRPKKLAPFIARIARNLAMKRLTYRNAAKRSMVTVPYEEMEACIDTVASAEDRLQGKVLTDVLERFLDTLDPQSRDMFLRRYWFFDSISQIAVGFGFSQSKVKSQLFRIRNKLKVFLAEEADIYVR